MVRMKISALNLLIRRTHELDAFELDGTVHASVLEPEAQVASTAILEFWGAATWVQPSTLFHQ